MALLFWAFAAASIAGALFVVTRRNLIAAVMGMVGSFIGIAAVYMMLYAQFLAVIQMLVYAGAIMVLFVFVIMILNRPEDEPVAPTGRAGQILGGLSIVYLVARLASVLINVVPPDKVKALAAPAAITLAPYGTTPAEVGRLGHRQGGRQRPVRAGPVPVRSDLDPPLGRGGRRDRDRPAAPSARRHRCRPGDHP